MKKLKVTVENIKIERKEIKKDTKNISNMILPQGKQLKNIEGTENE